MFKRFSSFLGLAAIFTMLGAVTACTDPVGSRYSQDIGTLTSGNTSPHRAGWVDGEGSMDASSPSPITSFVSDRDGITGQTTGVTTGLFAPVGTIPVGLISGKDTTIKAKKIVTGGDAGGGFQVDELEISTSASAPTEAQAALYQHLVPLWTAMSADQRSQVVDSLNAAMAGAGDIFAAAMEAAAKVFVPVP